MALPIDKAKQLDNNTVPFKLTVERDASRWKFWIYPPPPPFKTSRSRHANFFFKVYPPPPLVTRDGIYERPLNLVVFEILKSAWNSLFGDAYIHTRTPTRTCLHLSSTCSPGFGCCKWVFAKMTCVELHHVGGQPATKNGNAQQSCELGVNSCTCISSGTLSILTCRQKKHAIEVLGRVLTAVVVLRRINVLTFSRVHTQCMSHTQKAPGAFSHKGVVFRALSKQRIPRVPRAPKARATKSWRYSGQKAPIPMWMGVTATRWRVVNENLLSVKADYLKRSVLKRRHCFIVRQKCDIFHPPWPPPLSRDRLLQWSLNQST